MGDGTRRFTITMTLAQYDVLKAAMDETLDRWEQVGTLRRTDRHTLKRAMAHITKEFDEGVKGL